MAFKYLCFLVLAAPVWFALPQAAIADENSDANRLIVEAVQLLIAADEEQDASKKVELLLSAKQKLESIIENYPGSDAAVKLATGQNIGNLSIDRVSGQLAGSSAQGLHDLALAQFEAENIDGALVTLDTASEAAQFISDAVTRHLLLLDITLTQAFAGGFDAAFKTAQSINNAYRYTQALDGIASAQIYAEDYNGTLFTLSTAIKSAQSITYTFSRAQALLSIAEKQAQAKDIDGAVITFGIAIEAAQSINVVSAREGLLAKIRSSALAKFFPKL